jgi:predicted secreted protein
MAALSAFGTFLKIGNGGGPETFTTISYVRDISGPSLEMEALETTNHSSTSGWRTFIGGLLTGGEVTLEILYDPDDATHNATAGLINDMENRTVRNFQLVFTDPTPTTWSFAALVTGFEPSAPYDDLLTASVTLTVSGVPTLA